MKVSYKWLETYFEKTPPAPEKIAELLTAHAFEIESLEKVGTDTVFDVKVLPDRAHDCLSHMGIAREVSVLSGAPLKKEKISPKKLDVPESNLFRAEVADQKLCRRFSALVIEGIEVKDSPLWLVERLEALGQRSINNIVDATNYVMFAVGQPLHAYDRELLTDSGGSSKLGVRLAHDGETLTALDGKEYTLTTENLIIVDGNTDNALGIAGVKGGKAIEVSVHDTGIGIPPEEQTHIFERFYRGEKAQQVNQTGSGLGLYLTKLIVEQHKGKIWLDSAKGQGTTFHFVLPSSR
jgi:phenylalanyl-tRNA synthetase beta chain